MTPWRREFEIDDGGRAIRVREWGDPGGPPIVFHHGTPSSSSAVPGGWQGPATARVHLLSFDRPGYGGSTRQPERRVADAARWSALVADAVGVDAFAVMGTSGGGPHAVATAALLGERVTRLCVDVGLGPIGVGGFDGSEGMVDATVAEIHAARRGENALRDYIIASGEDPLDAWLTQLPESDREMLSRPDVQREESLEAEEWPVQGIDGWVDDDLALFGRAWDINLAAIAVPTLLVYGGSDVLVPVVHGRAYERTIRGSTLHVVPGGGHWLRDHELDLLNWATRTDQVPA